MQYFPVSKILGHRNILKESQGKINNLKEKELWKYKPHVRTVVSSGAVCLS